MFINQIPSKLKEDNPKEFETKNEDIVKLCLNCNKFFGTFDKKGFCYQCYLHYLKQNNIPIPICYIKQTKNENDLIFDSILKGRIIQNAEKSKELLNISKDSSNLLSILPSEIFENIQKEYLNLKYDESMIVSEKEIKILLNILKNPQTTYINFINFLIELKIISLTMKTCHNSALICNHSLEDLTTLNIFGPQIINGICIHTKTFKIKHHKLFTAEQGYQLYNARKSQNINKYQDELDWIWEHLICLNIGDYWNICEKGFGTVSICYYHRSAPSFIVDDEYISDDHSFLIAKTNKEKLLTEIEKRSKNGFAQIKFGLETSMFTNNKSTFECKLYNHHSEFVKTINIPIEYLKQILN